MREKQLSRRPAAITLRVARPESSKGVVARRFATPFGIPQGVPPRSGFTLTELLIVIAIMAVLTGLVAAAAVNAMNKSRRSAITLEIKNISGSIENFKNDFGAYPPNGMNPEPDNTTPAPGSEAALVQADFQRMFKRAFPRNQEPPVLIASLCGQNVGAAPDWNLEYGMTAAEALVFWLGGFSDDEQYPISGPGGPSFADPAGGSLEASDEVLEDRNRRYEFDISRLGPRNAAGAFDDANNGRFLLYEINLNGDADTNDPGEKRRINMWRYIPEGSEQPLLYFDVSRYKPWQYDVWASSENYIFAIKTRRSGATGQPADATEYQSNVVFVDQGKFQLLHCGPDDAWGDEFSRMSLEESTGYGWGSAADFPDISLYPDGPYLGDIADTLTSFTDGTLAEETEE
jgi:prepilin-type N-terminal cleavage/methylation domain-containing protein